MSGLSLGICSQERLTQIQISFLEFKASSKPRIVIKQLPDLFWTRTFISRKKEVKSLSSVAGMRQIWELARFKCESSTLECLSRQIWQTQKWYTGMSRKVKTASREGKCVHLWWQHSTVILIKPSNCVLRVIIWQSVSMKTVPTWHILWTYWNSLRHCMEQA